MKPINLILDLLRTYAHKGTSVKNIMSVGASFGLSENLMRVTLTRLAAKHAIENISRGHYRLSKNTDPVSEFVEQWRLGEKRVHAWSEGRWLCVHVLLKNPSRGVWILRSLGFRELAENLWFRPDNLNLSVDSLTSCIHSLGVPDSAVLISDATISQELAKQWFAQFSIDELNQSYIDMRTDLKSSLKRLPTLPVSDAKRESFELGGRAIQLLVKDPLIPEQHQAVQARETLWKTMLEYDAVGRNVWFSSQADAPDTLPTQTIKINLAG